MDELTKLEDLRSELFSARTDLDAARAAEKRYLWYMLLGGSPGMLLTFSALFWDRGLILGLLILVLPLWFAIRWSAAAREAHGLEVRMNQLKQARAHLEQTHTDRGTDAPDPPASLPDVLPPLERGAEEVGEDPLASGGSL